MDNVTFIVQQLLYFAIPLLIAALGGMFSERSGIVNIALEGIMLFGAFIGVLTLHFLQSGMTEAALYQLSTGQLYLLLGLLAAAIAGGLFSLLHAYASINMRANQVISGTALNLIAPAIAIYVARLFTFTNNSQQISFIGKRSFFINEVPYLSKIPIIGQMFFAKTYITTYIGILVLILAYIFLYKTKIGLRLRACGEHPQAASAAGINVARMRYLGVVLSGILAGMAGYILIVTTQTEFNASVFGYGFLALAVVIFGQWHPIRIFFVALFFGLMNTIASAYVSIPFLYRFGAPGEFYKTIPYVATLIVLGLSRGRGEAPRAAGEIYDPGKR